MSDSTTGDLTVDFFTRALAHRSGVSRAALDALLAISRCVREVRVYSWGPKRLPAELDGVTFGAIRNERIGLDSTLRAWLAGDAPPAALLAQARLALRDYSTFARRARPGAGLEIVNGLGAHPLAARAGRPGAARARALIVHESVRHFDAARVLTPAKALEVLRSYDYRVFVSQRGRQEWNALGQLPEARSCWIPNCVREQRVLVVSAQPRAQLAQRLGYAADALQVVCVASVSARKGQDVLLEAAARVRVTLPRLRIDFLGARDAAFARQLEQRARQLGLEGRVRWLGNVSDVFERVYAADVLVLASRAEAFPLATLEAMALGTCVVASNVDGVPEQIAHGRDGLLFPSENAAALAERLIELAGEPARRMQLAAAGHARYWEEFSRARQLRRWAAALGDMLGAGA